MREHKNALISFSGIILVLIFVGIAFMNTPAVGKNTTTSGKVSQVEENDCTGCHEMKPEIVTWQMSSHSRFPCTTCHIGNLENCQEKHNRGDFTRPIVIADAIPSSVCLQCHTTYREATPSGDLIIPHNKHYDAGVTCVKCHGGVVHGKIAERGLTAADSKYSNYDEWDKDLAKTLSVRVFKQPNMWTCINCHRQAKVSRRCGICHTTIPNLASHDDPSWSSTHGKTARLDIGKCTVCHVTPGKPNFITPSSGDLSADFARAQDFCRNCHMKRPKMHGTSMAQLHPQLVQSRGVSNCMTCHNSKPEKSGGQATKTYCNKCHWLK